MKPTQKENKLLKATFEACRELKGQDILLVDLTKSETYTDWIFIVSGTNDRQMRALADRVVEKLYTDCQLNPLGVEGYEGAQWILVDFGSLVCHIFLSEIRENYHLEDMWPRVKPLRETEIAALVTPPKKKRATAAPKKAVENKIKVKKRGQRSKALVSNL